MVSVSRCCKSRCFKTANIRIKILFANSKLTEINVMASFCALNLPIKFDICCFKAAAFRTKKD